MSTPQSAAKTDPLTQAKDKHNRRLRWLVAAPLVVCMLLTTIYTVASGYITTQLVQQAQLPFHTTPANFDLQFRNVSFTSRDDHLSLRRIRKSLNQIFLSI